MTFVPKITKPDITLQNVTFVTDVGTLIDLKSIKFERKIKKNDRTPGSSKTERAVLGKQTLAIEFEGLNGKNLSHVDIYPGLVITEFTADDNATTPESLLWADVSTLWPFPWYFGDVGVTIKDDPSTFTGEILTNIDGVD